MPIDRIDLLAFALLGAVASFGIRRLLDSRSTTGSEDDGGR